MEVVEPPASHPPGGVLHESSEVLLQDLRCERHVFVVVGTNDKVSGKSVSDSSVDVRVSPAPSTEHVPYERCDHRHQWGVSVDRECVVCCGRVGLEVPRCSGGEFVHVCQSRRCPSVAHRGCLQWLQSVSAALCAACPECSAGVQLAVAVTRPPLAVRVKPSVVGASRRLRSGHVYEGPEVQQLGKASVSLTELDGAATGLRVSTMDTQSRLLQFRGFMWGRSTQILVDPGADTDLINLAHWPALDPTEKAKWLSSAPISLSLSGVHGVQSVLAWRTRRKARVKVGSVTRSLPAGALVVNIAALKWDLILGMDFLERHDPVCGSRTKSILFKDHRRWTRDGEEQMAPDGWVWSPTDTTSRLQTPMTRRSADRARRRGEGQCVHIVSRLLGDLETADLHRRHVMVYGARPGDPGAILSPDASVDTSSDDQRVPQPTTLPPVHGHHGVGSTEITKFHRELLGEFRDIAVQKSNLPPLSAMKDNGVRHRVDLEPGWETKWKHRPPPRLSKRAQDEMKHQLRWMYLHGFIRPSRSRIASAVFFVPKGGTGLRMVSDFRQLNQFTVPDRFPSPNMEDQLARVAGHKFYSVFDFVSGFYEIRMREGDEWKTAFHTHWGLWEYVVMPMGMRNSPATFSRLTQKLFGPQSNCALFASVFVDDICVFSDSWEAHKSHVRAVLLKCREAGLYVNLAKSDVGAARVQFLGDVVSEDGRSPAASRVALIRDWPLPQSHEDVRRFLGHAGYVSGYIPGFAARAKPLYQCRAGKSGSGGRQPAFSEKFGPAQLAAFEDLKGALTSTPVLRAPDFEKPWYIQSDASEIAGAAALLQEYDGTMLPVAYASKLWLPTESAWPAHDRELAAVKFGLEAFKYYVALNSPTCILDHKPLLHIRSQPKLSRRQLDMIETIDSYGPRFQYRPGTQMHYADLLSRPPGHVRRFGELATVIRHESCSFCADEQWRGVCSMHEQQVSGSQAAVFSLEGVPTSAAGFQDDHPLSVRNILDAYVADEMCTRILSGLGEITDNHFKRRYEKSSEGLIFTRSQVAGRYQSRPRLVLPSSSKVTTDAALDLVHRSPEGGHLGADSTYDRLIRRFWFRGAWTATQAYVRGCAECQLAKHTTLAKAGLSHATQPPPLVPGAHLTTDFTFGLPPSKDPVSGMMFTGVQVYVCRLSGRVRLLPVQESIKAEECALLYRMHVAPAWGQMVQLTSDRDPRFESAFWKQMAGSLGIRLSMSTARHPGTDGLSENVFGTLDLMLRAFCGSGELRTEWVELLPALEFAINSNPSASRERPTPFEVWQGFVPLSVADTISPSMVAAAGLSVQNRVQRQQTAMRVARDALAASQDSAAARTDPGRRETRYEGGNQVLVHKAFLRPPSDDSTSFASKTKTRFKFSGPYRVAERVGPNAVRLDQLPLAFKGHPVFNVAAIKPFRVSTVPGCTLPLLSNVDPSVEDGMDSWMVGAVIASRIRRGSRHWLVRWAGLGEAHDSWEPLASFVSSRGISQALKEFEEASTGSLERLNTLVHDDAVFADYPDGACGSTLESADGFQLYYTDDSGETLNSLATRYAVSARQLQRWNRANISHLRRGRVLPPGTAIRVGERTVMSLMYEQPVFVALAEAVHGFRD